jgi:Ca-activated chloride channel family protein
LVLVPVTVTDSLNRPVPDLDKTNFHVFEGGIEQRVSYLSCEDAPIAVGLVFDASARSVTA